jgi:hypothetical protein
MNRLDRIGNWREGWRVHRLFGLTDRICNTCRERLRVHKLYIQDYQKLQNLGGMEHYR